MDTITQEKYLERMNALKEDRERLEQDKADAEAIMGEDAMILTAPPVPTLQYAGGTQAGTPFYLVALWTPPYLIFGCPPNRVNSRASQNGVDVLVSAVREVA